MSNILNIGKRYLRFFVDNVGSRHLVVQGGRRSAKSFSVYKWVRFLASGKPKRVLVVTATYPALQLAIDDFQRSTGLTVGGNVLLGYSCQMPNGSVWQFKSFDSYTKAQGTTADICILEEALNIDETIVSTLMMSVTEQVFFVFNPTRTSYIDKYILPDKSNYLKTTYLDNPFLTESQIGEFEAMKKRAASPTASILDLYQWKVYGEGDFSSMSGRVFKRVYTCTDDDYSKIPATEVFGLDFGFTPSEQSDATALVGVKIYDGKLYAKEYLYGTDLTDNRELALRMAAIGLDENAYICADTGGMGRTRVRALITAGDYTWTEPQICNGFNICAALKGKVLDGLNAMNQYEIYVTDSSLNLREEMDKYELTADGKVKSGCADHALDGVRYCCTTYKVFCEY